MLKKRKWKWSWNELPVVKNISFDHRSTAFFTLVSIETLKIYRICVKWRNPKKDQEIWKRSWWHIWHQDHAVIALGWKTSGRSRLGRSRINSRHSRLPIRHAMVDYRRYCGLHSLGDLRGERTGLVSKTEGSRRLQEGVSSNCWLLALARSKSRPRDSKEVEHRDAKRELLGEALQARVW